MSTLDQIKDGAGPVHLLLVADTKGGKSTYAAEAAIAGFHMIYMDSDNGLSALRARISKEPNPGEILKRIHYFNISRPREFLLGFMRSRPKFPFFWVERLQTEWKKTLDGIEDDDQIFALNIKGVPDNWVFSIDSWTSLTQDALKQLRPEQVAPLISSDKGENQGVYGDAGAFASYACNMLQIAPMHLIVQAHGTRYEQYEKPQNTTGALMKQAVMTLVDTFDVPVSSSRIHGFSMGKSFNHIGWLSVSGTGMSDIDFTRKPKRIGGGPPNRKARTNELGFLSLVKESGGGMPSPDDSAATPKWYAEMTHKELMESGGKYNGFA